LGLLNEEINKERERERELTDLFVVCAGFSILLYAGSWVVGWIFRGFMGIPMGMDSKPK